MPYLVINTNLPRSKISKEFLAEAAEVMAKALRRPVSICCVQVNADVLLALGDPDEPTIQGSLTAIGRLGGDLNKDVAKALFEFLEPRLGVKGDRIAIQFIDLKGSELAVSGKTVENFE